MVYLGERPVFAHVPAQRGGMGGIEPIVRADEYEFAPLFQMLDAFQYEHEEIVAKAVEIAVPQFAVLQLLLQLGLNVLPTNVWGIAYHHPVLL